VQEGRHEILFAEPGDDACRWDFDVLAFIETTVRGLRGRIDGVFSSSDYPGATVAAAIATELGLPGPHPGTVLRSSHKYYSRMAQREAAPEAVPRFDVVSAPEPGDLSRLFFPCFVKPVKGAFSVLARRIGSPEELRAFLARPSVEEFTQGFMHIFNRLLARFADPAIDGSHFIVEEVLSGQQVTVEGFLDERGVELLGIVDSTMYPGTSSFARFDYPSALPAEVAERMAGIARRVVERLGLARSIFNIEMIFDASTGRIGILEVNPRMCGQFSDLYEKVDGAGGYDAALSLATGERPELHRRAGAFAAAASCPLRVFAPARVVRAPTAEDIARAESVQPGTLVWSECSDGEDLSDFETCEDGSSRRYGVVNLGGEDRPDIEKRLAETLARLGYDIAPLGSGGM